MFFLKTDCVRNVEHILISWLSFEKLAVFIAEKNFEYQMFCKRSVENPEIK